ncbi:MAG TPA: D-aminoacyl-tRNA deacylase [Methanospirillum sp.]|uniref:D-aminoacyl-tRNA deacylase n=1 Tax=Methanospirillum sp. TaxID=45200 RepID=UPI002BCE6440|nr:D-aminoacyl-tRNA deacylase [Methanospirillum sp.]HWQ63775.1 D-aminoacyl-tRNA deacylase [Methanospirillum sp.]
MKNGKIQDKILLVSSLADRAGSLIHEEIRRFLSKNPVLQKRYQHRQFDERLIYIEASSLTTDADLIIFLSRHASKEPRSVLSVHVTGNFGDAVFGGNPGTLTPAATGVMHAILNRLANEVPEGYEVTYEATHHGPTSLPIPSCFVEIGSTEKEWKDRNAAAVIARAVIDADPEGVISLAGFGGTHYAQRQTEITLTTRGGFGHIMPTRDLVYLNQAMFDEMVSSSGAEAIYIDRKSISRIDIERIEEYASKRDLIIVGQSDLQNMRNVSLSDYCCIRKLAEEILAGSGITIHGKMQGFDLTPITIPSDLLFEATKTNLEEFTNGIQSLPIIHLSGKGIAVYPTFITNQENALRITNELIHLCVSILHRNCICRFDGDCLIITKEKFDPGKAASLGISPGPLFGRLMAGEVVLHEGREITPSMVKRMTEKKICIPGWGT